MKMRLKAPKIRRTTSIFVISAPELTKINDPCKFHDSFTTPSSTALTFLMNDHNSSDFMQGWERGFLGQIVLFSLIVGFKN